MQRYFLTAKSSFGENLTNEDEPFYNEIAGALDFFDKNIEAMENAHKSITNMANIDS